MAVGELYDVPSNVEEFKRWSFAHAAHHFDIQRVVFQLSNQRLDLYILDPFDPNHAEAWIYQHQVMHNQQNRVLGIQGQNLTFVDFHKDDNLAGWIYAHANEHYQAAQILRLG